MTTTTTSSSETDRPAGDGRAAWVRLVAATAAVVAAVDLALFAVIREVIPPLAVGAVLTVVGLVLLRSRERAGIVVLGLTSVVMFVGSIPFAADHLGHPDSGVDWTHSVVGTVGRLVAIGAAVAALRSGSAATARRISTISIGALGLVVVVALVTTIAASGDTLEPGDVRVDVERTSFPDDVVLDAGSVAFVDNKDLYRHTFTVEGTDLDVNLPAKQAVRIPIELEPGTYELICDIPGHESMTTTLTVQ